MRYITLFYFLLLLILSPNIDAESKPASAKKIIALSPHSVEMLYAIGAGDQIIATLEYSDYPPPALSIPRIGNFTGIQIEKIIALQPDLIIAWKSGNKLADLKKIESLGFNIFYSKPENISEISLELIKLGKLTGHSKEAITLAANIADKHQQIIDRFSATEQINVFYQLWHDPLRTIGSGSWLESLINDCNGRNIFNDAESAYPIVSLETILSRNPEVIIIPGHPGTIDTNNSFWDKWQNISAVKHNKIFTIDGDLLHRFTPRAIDGLELLCQSIDNAR